RLPQPQRRPVRPHRLPRRAAGQLHDRRAGDAAALKEFPDCALRFAVSRIGLRDMARVPGFVGPARRRPHSTIRAMDRPPLLQQPWLRWLAVFGFWTLLALFDTSQNYLLLHFFVRHPQPMPLKEILILNLFHWYLWGATVPLLAWLARCFPITPPRWHRSLTPLIVISVLCSLFRVILDIPVEILVRTDWGYLVVRPGWDLTSMCDL